MTTLDQLLARNSAVPGVRTWFGISGQRHCEVFRNDRYVILVPDYCYENQQSRRCAMTVPLEMLQKFFVEGS